MNFLVIASSDESIHVFKDNSSRQFSNTFQTDEYDQSPLWQVSLRSIFIKKPTGDKILNVHLEQLWKPESYGERDTLLCTLPIKKGSEKYLSYEGLRGEYHPIFLTKPLKLTFECRNEKGDLSNITGENSPTLITLNFKKMSSPSKILHLCSASNKSQFKSNTLASFTNNLASPLDLASGNWQLALSSIVYPNNIEPSFPQFSSQWKRPYQYQMRIETYYESGLGRLKETITFTEDILRSKKKFLHFFLTEVGKYLQGVGLANNGGAIHFEHGSDFRIFFTVGLIRVMGIGFGNNEPEIGWFNVTSKPLPNRLSWHAYMMRWEHTWQEQKPSSMILYCDAITPISWGDKQFQILKIIPLDEEKQSKKSSKVPVTYSKYVPKHLDFIPIQKKFLTNISLSLQTHWGQEVNFKNEGNHNVDVNLLLVRK